MAYTRQKYIRSIPQSKIRRFTLGDKKGEYSHITLLRAKQSVNISSGALESARVTANKILEISGKSYLLKIVVYPHEINREHKFMGFAGADRLSQGMKKSFGRPKSRSAKVTTGQAVLAAYINSDDIDIAKNALKRASNKLPLAYEIIIEDVEVKHT
jgi:large subunit ribosomal protein L10e